MANFTHLHLHTQYSLLDGAIRVKDLFKKTQEMGMDTVAVTDHGNMFGAIDLYTEAKNTGTKLIFGCETYVASTDRTDRTNRRNYHLILLAKNDVGYKNLSFLNSKGYLEGFYYNPRIAPSSRLYCVCRWRCVNPAMIRTLWFSSCPRHSRGPCFTLYRSYGSCWSRSRRAARTRRRSLPGPRSRPIPRSR